MWSAFVEVVTLFPCLLGTLLDCQVLINKRFHKNNPNFKSYQILMSRITELIYRVIHYF